MLFVVIGIILASEGESGISILGLVLILLGMLVPALDALSKSYAATENRQTPPALILTDEERDLLMNSHIGDTSGEPQ